MADIVERKKICGSPLRKKPGQFCQQSVGLFPNGRCDLHNGKATYSRGIANPAYKDGHRSKYVLPPRMRADYETALSDPHLLELKHDIAVTHSRANDLMSRVDTGESGHLWKQIRSAFVDLQVASSKAAQIAALAELDSLIKRGTSDYHAWEEYGKQVDRKQRLVESERKRAVELHQTVTLDKLNPIFHAIVDFVRRRVPEREGLIEFQGILETHIGVGPTGVEEAIVVGEPGEPEPGDDPDQSSE